VGSRITIKTFDGDVDALYELIRDSWNEDYKDQIRFEHSREFLKWNIEAPFCDPDLLIGAYDGSDLVGFCGRFPRTLSISGQPIKAALGTFLTTHVKYRRQGIGEMVVESSVERLKEKGYDGYFYVLQKGHASTPLYQNLPIPQVLLVPRVRFYVKFLNADLLRRSWNMNWAQSLFVQAVQAIPHVKSFGGSIRSYTKEDLHSCLQLLNGFQQFVPIARRWTAEELAWRLEGFPSAFTYLLEEQGEIKGLINFYLMELCGNRWGKAKARSGFVKEKIAFIDNIRLDKLNRNQKQALLSHALQKMKEAGYTMALIPSFACLEPIAFIRNGFLLDIFTPPINLYWTVIQPRVKIPDVKGRLYVDFM
jgi:GNAT superfamily N-acetyltransferase